MLPRELTTRFFGERRLTSGSMRRVNRSTVSKQASPQSISFHSSQAKTTGSFWYRSR